jgi:co-chaperonin GroES (HSP10)
MKAINHYLIVDRIKTEPKKVAGLIITENIDDEGRYIKARVESTGNLVEVIKDNDVVYYDKHAGHSIQYQEKLYYVIKACDIVLVD